MKCRYLIGIDEAGRGPLAGPVAVGAVCVPFGQQRMLRKLAVRDSKQLSPAERVAWLEWLGAERIVHQVALVGHRVVDRRGIVAAVRLGIARSLARLARELACRPEHCLVFLDGALRAPSRYLNQHTIIRGDESEPVIALASIVAKVARDRRMAHLARRYPAWGFAQHKGYGTRAHYAALAAHGPSAIHRLSFLDS